METDIQLEACRSPERCDSHKFAKPGAFQCSICPTNFDTKDGLTTHIKNHFKTYTCPICAKEFIGDTSFEYHKTRHESVAAEHVILLVRSCKLCELEFPDAVTLSQHMKEDHKPDAIICDFCSNTFPSKGRLSRHIRDKHFIQNGEAVACDICGRVCPNHEAVSVHRRTHADDKDFYCDYCGKGFTRKKNLEFHIRSHTGIRPFECKVCPKSFATVSGLNCHVRTHTKERPFKCPFCTKCYMHSTDLRRHRRSHGGEEKRFQCDLCEMKFFERKFLTVHLNTHKKDKTQLMNIEMSPIGEPDEEGAEEEEYLMNEEYIL